ncbi:DUF4249 domain-containing protein [Hanstruepera ponticola]|uniref:DUF4249 domain-containing protein n=1 Tax=Hanstruepera ponticola TaxID=2042995 RepID=UPI0017869E32|nr:DUF4249 domain-containing protein [Hanstruepera ponticola]
MSCREPFEPESIEFLDALVVESTITNQLKHQEVKLSRTYRLEDNEPKTENNANVRIQDSNNTIYTFSQNQDGIYISDTEFQAQDGVMYQLFIVTQDGNEYQSSEVTLTPTSEISNLYAELTTKNNGEQGISVFVDSDNTLGEAKYFKYNYEETYKIIAPNYFPYDISLINLIFIDFGLIEYDIVITEREQEERVCYSTEKSFGVIQTATNDLENNIISRFEVNFIPITSPKIRDRYSIYVEQYVQSLEAYTFYKTINEFSGSNNILSQIQPGYVLGNIQSNSEVSEKVIGYFEAATISSDRIYFNYTDFDIQLPDYYYDCDLRTFDYNDPYERARLYSLVTHNSYKLASGVNNTGTIFDVVNSECGDCTSISSNIRPDFWED